MPESEFDANEALSRFADSRAHDVDLRQAADDELGAMEMVAKVFVWAVLVFTVMAIILNVTGAWPHAAR